MYSDLTFQRIDEDGGGGITRRLERGVAKQRTSFSRIEWRLQTLGARRRISARKCLTRPKAFDAWYKSTYPIMRHSSVPRKKKESYAISGSTDDDRTPLWSPCGNAKRGELFEFEVHRRKEATIEKHAAEFSSVPVIQVGPP